MPLRKYILTKGEIYHVYNKSVADEEIFRQTRNLNFSLDLIDYYHYRQEIRFSKFRKLNKELQNTYWNEVVKDTPHVEIYAYCLMPNHYHFLLKQLSDNGIQKFIANFQNSYARYFNLKNERRGSLFINPFKAKRVENDKLFVHISRYIHLNPVTSFLISIGKLDKENLTSMPRYLNIAERGFVNTETLIKMFGSLTKYKDFVINQEDYQKKLHLIKSHLFQ